ncbi:MAG TPA: RsmE family RNA methyltransferase [Elusimicrobiota bacterium]|nr:RsmE family RNA methyltransferase [Elusimicrobiota bacterium]
MPRFFVPPDQIRDGRFFISGSEAHHALHVLRKGPGDLLEIFDGRDSSYQGRIEHVETDRLDGVLLSAPASPRTSTENLRVILVQALIRGSKWDWLIEKCSELGVSALWPLRAARSIVKVSDDRSKEERWNRIALAAAKQCGRGDVMTIERPADLSAILGRRTPGSLSLIPWEKESDRSIAEACRGYRGDMVYVFVGPEGGWESQETQMACEAGVKPVRLGATLLRSETAGLVSATLVLGELGSYR